MLSSVDAYAQYSRYRQTRGLGLRNRRLAVLLGDFAYETSSAEDESRRYLELLHDVGKRVLTGSDLRWLEAFTSEHNREQRRAETIEEVHVSWGRVDGLSQKIIEILSRDAHRDDAALAENSTALERMFRTTEALRRFRNRVAHRTPNDHAGQLRFYRDASVVTPREIWGWTEVAASYWSNLTSITNAISMATGVVTAASTITSHSGPLQWPPIDTPIHGLRVIAASGIPVPDEVFRAAKAEWASWIGRWQHRTR